jgi:Ca-activated chloride channel family protein
MRFAVAAVALAIALTTVVAVYSKAPVPPPCSRHPATLRVLATGDVVGLTKILNRATTCTGVKVQVTLTKNPAKALPGLAQDHYYAIWFASEAYLDLFPYVAKGLSGTTSIMSSPVVLAVRTSVAQRLGWVKGPASATGSASWAQIAQAADSGDFTFGMASPATADAGLSGLTAATLATTGSSGALEQGKLAGSGPEQSLTRLFHGQVLSAPDSADLVQDYLAELKRPGPDLPGGLIDYEANLLTLKAEAPSNEAITLVYPSDGVIEANYPLSVLKTAPPAARAAFDLLVGYLTSPAVQQEIAATTPYRPVDPMRPAAGRPAIQDVLHPPASPTVINTLISVYLDHLRTPGHTIYVLDTSASMAGVGLADLKRALDALTVANAGLAGTFSDFRTGEEITFVPFNYKPEPAHTFTILGRDPGSELARIRGYVGQLKPHGETAIYSALEDAYRILGSPDAGTPGQIDSIVLITDGQWDYGISQAQFLAFFHSLSAKAKGKPAPVYPIVVGQVGTKELQKAASQLQQVATATGGVFIDARGDPYSALDTLVDALRGYQ